MNDSLKKKPITYILVGVIGFLIVLYLGLHFGYLAKLHPDNLSYALDNFMSHATTHPFEMAFNNITGLFLFFYGCGYACWYVEEKRKETMRPGREHGSASWYENIKKYNKQFTYPKGKKFADEVPSPKNKNMIFGDNLFMSMDTRQTLKNNNVVVIGGSGTGKSRFFVKPNLLQANCSYVVTDPSGELLESTGKFFVDQGYDVKVFNLVDMANSNCYNPFHYLHNDTDVADMVNCLIKNTNPKGATGGDPFWEKSETALLLAICYFLFNHCEESSRSFSTVMRLLRLAEVDENDSNAKSQLDLIFERIENETKNGNKESTDIAVKNYKTFRMGAGKTLKSILISCAVRLNAFNQEAVERLTSSDDIELNTVGDKKTIVYVVLSTSNSTFNFLAALMYSQMFSSLYFHAENETFSVLNGSGDAVAFFKSEKEAKSFISAHKDICRIKAGENTELLMSKGLETVVPLYDGTSAQLDKYIKTHQNMEIKHTGKRLKNHVRFMLDEFANIGQIPDFEQKLATMRKYEISCSIILQNLAQLKVLYKDSCDTIIGNCDETLFLGSPEAETLKKISELLGKETITIDNPSKSKTGSSKSTNSLARELATPDELRRMDNNHCILIIRALKPFYITKYNYPRHPNYKFTGDAQDKNIVTPESLIALSKNDLIIQEKKEIENRDSKDEREKMVAENDKYMPERDKERIDRINKKNKEVAYGERNSKGELYLQQKEVSPDSMEMGKDATPEEIENRIDVKDGFAPDYEFTVPEQTEIRTIFDETSEKEKECESTNNEYSNIEEDDEDDDVSSMADAAIDASSEVTETS